jgi:hypothetical protein
VRARTDYVGGHKTAMIGARLNNTGPNRRTRFYRAPTPNRTSSTAPSFDPSHMAGGQAYRQTCVGQSRTPQPLCVPSKSSGVYVNDKPRSLWAVITTRCIVESRRMSAEPLMMDMTDALIDGLSLTRLQCGSSGRPYPPSMRGWAISVTMTVFMVPGQSLEHVTIRQLTVHCPGCTNQSIGNRCPLLLAAAIRHYRRTAPS